MIRANVPLPTRIAPFPLKKSDEHTDAAIETNKKVISLSKFITSWYVLSSTYISMYCIHLIIRSLVHCRRRSRSIIFCLIYYFLCLFIPSYPFCIILVYLFTSIPFPLVSLTFMAIRSFLPPLILNHLSHESITSHMNPSPLASIHHLSHESITSHMNPSPLTSLTPFLASLHHLMRH
jgi:hypothetical protein